MLEFILFLLVAAAGFVFVTWAVVVSDIKPWYADLRPAPPPKRKRKAKP